MTNLTFQRIIKESQKEIMGLAKKNGWLWFYNMHQKEVIKYAERLLKIYRKADKEVVLIACWLHDIAQYHAKNSDEIAKVKKKHHITGAIIANDILAKYQLEREEINKIKNCILRHRNKPYYRPKTLEEKILVVADTLSHFGSIFYLTYFKFHPNHSLEVMVKEDSEKLKRDWRDLALLPEARKLVEAEYRVLKKLLENYKSNNY